MFLGLLGGALMPAEPVGAQQGQSPSQVAFRADVDLALHAIAVLDSEGRPVTDLTASDFVLYEDGLRQPVSHFLAPGDSALDVALVLDSSSSLAPWARVVRRAGKAFLSSLAPEDCVYVLPFNGQVGPGRWGKAADPATAHTIDGIFMQGGTALYDAVINGLETVERVSGAADPGKGPASFAGAAGRSAPGPAGPEFSAGRASSGCGVTFAATPGEPLRRRALVLLTDGADRSSARRFDEVLARAQENSIPIFPVVMGQAGQDERLRGVLDALAGNTGGTVITRVGPEELEGAYDDVVALLRASYLLGYPPPPSEGPHWREISVRSRRPSYRLVHRDRYYR